jgi:enoyl reductase-like protein
MQEPVGMPSTTASHDEVRELLGEVDDLTIERVVETGATIDEVAEALGQVEAEEDGEALEAMPSSSRVVEVRAILDELAREQEPDEVMVYETR